MKTVYRAGRFYLSLVLAAVGMLLGFGISNAAAAQEAIPLPIEDALKVRSFADFGPARFSPDGKKFAYTVQDHQRTRSTTLEESMRTGILPWAIGSDIHVLDVASGKSTNITGGVADNWLPAWSPDGRYLAFLSDRGDGDHARLWVWDTVSNERRKVSEARILVSPGANDILWAPDSKQIVITAAPERPVIGADTREKALPVSPEPGLSTPESTVILYGSDAGSSSDKKGPAADPWDLDMYLRDLILIDLSDGSYHPILHGRRIAQYRMSPDVSHIAYTIAKRFEKPGSQQILFDLASIAVATGKERVLAADIRLDTGGAFSWSPDGYWIAFRKGGMEDRALDCYVVRSDGGSSWNISRFPMVSERKTHETTGMPLWDSRGANVYFLRDGTFWRATPEGSTAERVADIPGRRIVRLTHQSGNVLWTPSDQQAIVVTHDDEGKQDGFYQIDLNRGTSSKLMEKAQCYTCANVEEWRFADVTRDGQIVFFAEDAQHSTDFWIADSSFRIVRRLTILNPQFDRVAMGAARLINWQTKDGERLKGALLLPSNYEKGKRCPLIVWVYGGYSLSDRVNRFGLGNDGPFNMQLLATRGYAVLMPDAPQHLGTPMADLAKTILPGVDKVIDMGIADPERLGIMGHSYGSYSTLSLIVQTQRFKAALASDGLGDLVSAYGQMDARGSAFQTSIMEGGQGLMGGPPWEFPQRYIENSPFFYLDRVNTPLLVVHGAQDVAVSSFLGDELFVGLRRLGRTVLYAKYQGEGHSPVNWSYENQLDLTNRMIAWFNKYLKKASDPRSSPDAKVDPLSER